MTSRRLTGVPFKPGAPYHIAWISDCAPQQIWPAMSDMGQSRPSSTLRRMSEVPSVADIERTCWQFREAPTGEMTRQRLGVRVGRRLSSLAITSIRG